AGAARLVTDICHGNSGGRIGDGAARFGSKRERRSLLPRLDAPAQQPPADGGSHCGTPDGGERIGRPRSWRMTALIPSRRSGAATTTPVGVDEQRNTRLTGSDRGSSA